MDYSELLEVLVEQEINLDRYLQLTKTKQDAIVHNDLTRLMNTNSAEEKILLQIKNIETKWLKIIKKNNMSKDHIEEINISTLDEDDALLVKNLREHQNNIKKLAAEITEANGLNRYLISNARDFIKEILTSIFNNKTKSIIDRKI